MINKSDAEIRKILGSGECLGKIVTIYGWVKHHRTHGKHISFIQISDGSTYKSLQVTYKKEIKNIPIGSAIKVTGEVILSQGEGQKYELRADYIQVLKEAKGYPMQKKEQSLEWLREIAHIRHRTGIFTCVNTIRNTLYQLVNEFFKKEGFTWIQAPILTNNSCEGGADSFKIHNSQKFFKEDALLSVSGQFHAEALSLGLKKVYTFGPTFRAEKSNTANHLAEFWMIEAEINFCDLKELMNFMEHFIRFIVHGILGKCLEEIKFLSKNIENNEDLIYKLEDLLKSKAFEKLDYKDAINLLLRNNVEINFGDDFSTEQEKLILKKIKGPVFIYNFPKKIKSFYMKQIDDSVVSSVDLLIPGVGELIGGSERESSKEVLIQKANEAGISLENLQWYVDLREHGYYSSAGFGCGFERLLLYITGIKNIRDVINFPRSYGGIKY